MLSCGHTETGMRRARSETAGSIHLIVGPMFARKTTTMLAEIERNIIAKNSCAIIKHKKDDRYDNMTDSISMATHGGNVFNKCPILLTDELKQVDDRIRDFNVVGISEGQFYEDLAEYADKWADDGIIVIVEGLNGDYLQRPFKPIVDITPLATSVLTLTAVCMRCFSGSATYSMRTTPEKEVKVIGGSDKYVAVCRKCRKEMNKSSGDT